MTLLYYNPTFLDHDTGRHPENARRLQTIVRRLGEQRFDGLTLFESCERPRFAPASDTLIAALHPGDRLAELDRLAAAGGGRIDADTVVGPMTPAAARLAAGAAVDAVKRVLAGQARRALCLVRPPGHHATADRAMGFCLVNNVAVATRVALDQGAERVLIIDWDVHHGNGTQDLFYRDPRVAFFSMHRWPFYPGSGAADETGAGDGLGATLNLPVTFGTSRDRCSSWFARELEAFADRHRPQLVLVSAGFDAHRLDPIGSLGWETEDFATLTATVMDIAAAHASGRLVSVLEGGYHPEALADSVATHLTELLERDADEAADK